jgi:hypothetical protein
MSEPIGAIIRIGGNLPRRLFDEITEGEPGEPGTGPNYAGCSLEQATGGQVLVCGGEENYGQFDFEDDLRQAGVPFDRHSDPKYEYEGDEITFRPGFDLLRAACSDEGTIYLEAEAVEAILDDTTLDLAGMMTRFYDLDGLKLLRFRREHPLPPLEIIEDEEEDEC